MSEITYIVGGDTFRDVVSPEYMPTDNFIQPLQHRAKFWVYNEPNVLMGKSIHDNAKRYRVDFHELSWPKGLLPIRSSYVRDDVMKGNPVRGVDPRIAEYLHTIGRSNWETKRMLKQLEADLK